MPLSKDPEKRRKHLEAISGKNNKMFGKHHTNATKEKMSLHHPSKKPEYRKKLSDLAIQRGTFKGEKNGNYKGDNAGYDAIHKWISKRYPHKGKCEVCGCTDKKLVLSCIGEYKRDPSQFAWMCWSCQCSHDKKSPCNPQNYFPSKFTKTGQKIKKTLP